jgi:hypothetical protein
LVDFHNRGTKKLDLEIEELKIQKNQNRGTKSAFKPKINKIGQTKIYK